MKFDFSSSVSATIVMSLLASLSLLAPLRGQVLLPSHESQNPFQHHWYKLVDIGTLGGPHSYGETNGPSLRLLSDRDVVGSFADTTEPDPNAPNCVVPDCQLAHAFRRKNGVMTDLGSLPGVNFSAGGSTNVFGWIAGKGSSSTTDP